MTLTTLDAFNLIASIASIILSVLAIGLSLTFFFASKKAERNSYQSTVKIEEATSTLSKLSLRMLNQLTNAITAPKPTDEKISDIIREARTTGLKDTGDGNPAAPTKEQLDQFRVDNLIAAMFYAALSNIVLQDDLPVSIGGTEANVTIAAMVDQSKGDYMTLKNWIQASDQAKVNNSPVKHMYDYSLGWEGNIKSVREYYAHKENEA